MIPEAARVWARYRELRRDNADMAVAPEGCAPSVVAKGLNNAGNVGGDLFDVAGLRKAEVFEARRPDISVVIPTKNTRALLEQCVDAVHAHAAYPTEVIVVDGDSTDGSMSAMESRARVRAVRISPWKSFANSCNVGASLADGRVIIFLNSDAIPTAKWDVELMAALKIKGAGAAGPMSNMVKGKQFDYEAKYVATKDDPRPHERYAWAKYCERSGKVVETHDISGMCLAINADCWDDVGEFDERFEPGNFEDNDWCARAHLRGYRLFIARGSYVHHLGMKTYEANGLNNRNAFEVNHRRFLEKWTSDLQVA